MSTLVDAQARYRQTAEAVVAAQQEEARRRAAFDRGLITAGPGSLRILDGLRRHPPGSILHRVWQGRLRADGAAPALLELQGAWQDATFVRDAAAREVAAAERALRTYARAGRFPAAEDTA